MKSKNKQGQPTKGFLSFPWMPVYQHVATWQEGRRAIPMDVRYNPETMDLLTAEGFGNALFQTLNIMPGAGSLTAPVCSTFVVVCPGFMKQHPQKSNR